ncbi:MAG: Maf family protein [Christensenellales bacterium]
MNHPVILASASPRRKELLSNIIRDFAIIPSSIPEVASGSPRPQVIRLAKDKAADIAKDRPDAVVIGADTLVAIDQEVLGKPKNQAEAASMLKRLSGRTHQVYTGVAVIFGPYMQTDCGVTEVTFNKLTAGEIGAYIQTREPMDKAGAYGIQGYGGKFVRKINGCYFNVMGLPLSIVYGMLKNIRK